MLASRAARAGPADEVNPFIGAGGIGYGAGSAFPGPCLPFGMARPGPDTAIMGAHLSFHHCSGYHYSDNQIRGFSHTRLSGTGLPDYGNVLVMPTMKRKKDYSREKTHRARFTHDKEEAEPGYYAVTLDPSGIRAELTATRHCGLHRYTFPEEAGRIIIKADHAIMNDVCAAWIEKGPAENTFQGMAHQCGSLTGRNGGVEVFFAVRIRGGVKGTGLFGEGRAGKPSGAWVEPAGPGPVEVEAGLSFISVESAARHLDRELAGKSFDQVRAEAKAAWDEALSVIEIRGGSEEQRRIFYTALYHCMIMPTDVTEAGGLYRGFDEKVHRADGFRYYTDFSLWDTFRTAHPLLSLIEPARSADMMQSLVMMAKQGGWLPKWPTGYRYTSCMIGASADNAVADAWLKGVRGFDVEKAYEAGRWMAMNPVPHEAGYAGREGIEDYISLGYVPSDRHGSAASRTIEFSYNDWCLANLAEAVGKQDDARMFHRRAKSWRALRDPGTGFLRGKKSDGAWAKPFVPWSWAGFYVEGNARQWLWAPLHDPEGLIEFLGGPDEFARRLDGFFAKSARRPDTLLPDPFYWHGNEPDIHAAYLFNYAGRPDLARKWVRWIMEEKYADAPDGLDGNDDCGALSAWYVFSALGFYPVAGSDLYLAGAPLFDRAELHLPGGDLLVTAQGDLWGDAPVSVILNGERLEKPWFRHQDIADGGKLIFVTE